jgi:solute carrier family 25 2-oxodicarboxylate transporter 21
MEAPKRATKFAANDEWGKVWRNTFGVAKMNQSLSILTGASAGATEAIVVVPFELVKIRLQGKNFRRGATLRRHSLHRNPTIP